MYVAVNVMLFPEQPEPLEGEIVKFEFEPELARVVAVTLPGLPAVPQPLAGVTL